jgi:hypothetical protein
MAPESVHRLSKTGEGTPRGARESRLRWAPSLHRARAAARKAPGTGDASHCCRSAVTLPQVHTEAVRLGAGMRESAFFSPGDL